MNTCVKIWSEICIKNSQHEFWVDFHTKFFIVRFSKESLVMQPVIWDGMAAPSNYLIYHKRILLKGGIE